MVNVLPSAICRQIHRGKREIRLVDGSQTEDDLLPCGGEELTVDQGHVPGPGLEVEVTAAVLMHGKVLRVVKRKLAKSLRAEKERLLLRVTRAQRTPAQRRRTRVWGMFGYNILLVNSKIRQVEILYLGYQEIQII